MVDILTYDSKFIKSKLSVYLKEAIKNPNAELEMIFGAYENTNIINKSIFLELLNNLKQTHDYSEQNTLDIRLNEKNNKSSKQFLSRIRCSIEGVTDIKKYCKTGEINDLKNLKFIEKSFYTNPKMPDVRYNTILNTQYNLRINLKDETELSDLSSEVMKFKSNFNRELKYYRYKKRFSFTTSDKLFRIDLTAVKSSETFFRRGNKDYKLSKNLVDSNVLKNKETYELEIEYIGSITNIDDTKSIDEFISRIYKSSNIPLFQPLKGDGFDDKDIFTYNFDSDDETEAEESIEKAQNLINNLFPSVFSPITVDITRDISSKYWIDSDREWLYNEIIINEKTLYFINIRKNDIGDYLDAPGNTDYIEFKIKPEFEPEYIDENEEFPPDFNNTILIPLSGIYGTSELNKPDLSIQMEKPKQKLPSWGTKNRKNKKNKESEEKEESEKEEFEEKEIEFKPELILPENLEDPYLIQYEDLLEAGEFKEDLEIQQRIWEKKIKEEEEITGKGYNDQRVINEILAVFNNVVYDLFIIIHKTDLFVPKKKKDEIISNYRNLTEQSSKKTFFLGPNPVSLSLNELNPSNHNSILKGYVVTEKADGIRAQLLISHKECYLITQKLEVIDTGLLCENIEGTWLFDGEFITQNNSGGDINLYMIFDVYFAGDGSGKYPNHAYTYPWLNMKRTRKEINRSIIMGDFKTQASFVPKTDSKYNMIIGYKTYYEGPKSLKMRKNSTKYTNITKIGEMNKKILDRDDGYGYRIDGLIFLPMFLSVNSMIEGEIRKLGNYSERGTVDGKWTLNYKWKPPEENTIDFKVKIVQEKIKNKDRDKITTTIIDGKTLKCKQVELYVGYKYFEDPNFDYVLKILTDSYDKPPREIRFNPDNKDDKYLTNIPITGNTIICQRDNVELKDNMIIEMSYHPDNPDDSRWQPLRHRDDKIFPNALTTASNVWSTIQNPVTSEYIKGKKLDEIPDLIIESEETGGYYIDNSNNIGADIPLRDLHNLIKNKLISAVCSIGDDDISIMDTSIGRGGDIKKYLSSKNKIEFLFGLDISSDVTKKAAERYYNENMKKPKAYFMQYDTGELILKGNGYVGQDSNIERNKIMMNILLNKKLTIPKEYKSVRKDYKGLVSKGFDIISSQFTIHYYFENEDKLRNYLQNLSDHCKPNGYFIGTCYDGMKVFNLLKDKDSVSMFDDFENKIYSIAKDYDLDDFVYKKDDLSNVLGQKIKVEMSSIGQEITEFLVNFEFFIDIMKEYNFELVSPNLKGKYSGIFDTKDLSYKKGLGGFEQIIKKLPNLSSKDTSIKKFYPESLNILKEENIPLQQLSALNNWFIFQKKE